ncbi:NAD(+) diphosphatase [bacterium]|nr:NAD(+) diphosphatase [bacterium]
MIQDIYPSRFDIIFKNLKPQSTDSIIFFNQKGEILVKAEGDELLFPTAKDSPMSEQIIYLFSVDEKRYFLAITQNEIELAGFEYQELRELRGTCKNVDLLVAFTAYHLWRWYTDNYFCGRCAAELSFSGTERALVCKKCGNTIYPRINPAVIVAVTKGDTLLVTRYRNGYNHNALVAGFTEIGETLEQTVAREVMEETGTKVKNIRYYKSQPWGIAQDILVGYFCEADGDDKIRLDENELKFAQWLKRDEIELQPDSISLTNEMMKLFKEGKDPFIK